MSRVHVFVDESRRGADYYVIATIVASGDIATSRRTMRSSSSSGQTRVHFTDESNTRRNRILSAIAETETKSVIYCSKHKKDSAARYPCIAQLVADLPALSASRLIIESRQQADDQDKRWIKRERLRNRHRFDFDHLPGKSEPLLWIPDAIGWCYGRGGRWRQKVLDLGLIADIKQV